MVAEKTNYSIAQVSEMMALPESTLRYYEGIGLMEPVRKNSGGHRRYEEKDLRRIRFIQTLRNAGISVQEIKRYVDMVYEGVHTIPERKEILISQLDKLKKRAEELNQTIRDLEQVIDTYEDTLIRRELERRKEDPHVYTRQKS